MTDTQPTTIRLHGNDNVVVARDEIAQGADVAGEAVAANATILEPALV